MLVLTRKAHEQVKIGDAVVTIGFIKGKRVKLVINAPPEVRIERCELGERGQESRDKLD